MDDHDLPSDSDSSDEDFVPEGADSDPPSEEESGPEDAELEAGAGSGDEGVKTNGRKRAAKGKSKGSRKRPKKSTEEDAVEDARSKEDKAMAAEQVKLSDEEEKKKADSLWADFMKDVGGPTSRKATNSATKTENVTSSAFSVRASHSKTEPTEKENKVEKNKVEKNKVIVTQVFEFAGEEVKVTKEVAVDSPEARLSEPTKSGPSQAGGTSRGRGRGGGLSAVLSQIGKKSKISTLEKSKLDWERFKSEEGLQEEIQTFNRGKDGYLERQDFLERADLRQFEIEKQMRTNRRSNR